MEKQKKFESLLKRYETAFFELSEYETKILPEYKNGKVVNRKNIISLEDFESTIEFMEMTVMEDNKEFDNDNAINYEEGRIFFNWLIIPKIVRAIRRMI